jgi:hypothetical protein
MATKTKTSKKPSIRNTSKNVETKKAEALERKTKPTEVQEMVQADRELFLKMAREAGLKVDEKSAWFKVGGADKKRRMYVARKGPQVHFTFPVKGTESISEAEAKKRHIGSIRGILHLDRQKTDVLKGIFAEAIKALK